MNLVKRYGLVLAVGCFLGAQSLPEDPVMKARQQRAQAQGVNEADLPAVPRAVLEPPPLPPPELHIKDTPHARVAKTARHKGGKVAPRGKVARRGKAAASPATAPAAPRVAKRPRPAGKAPHHKKVRT